MGNPSLSMRFTVFLSFSFAASSSSLFFFFKPTSPPPSPSIPKASPSDLLSLLGPPSQSSSVNPSVANELKSCFKFLVPFTLTNTQQSPDFKFLSGRRSLLKSQREEENELIWWPPEPVLELARLAVDSGGDPGSIHRTLDPTVLPVPDVEGSKKNKCELTRTPYGRRFISQELNSYLEYLFKLIAKRGPAVGLKVSLNRYDLFHGHLFIAKETARLGILFHAKEYPEYDKEVFPCNMGYCQKGSNVTYDDSMNLRNILWLAPLPSNFSQGWMAPGVLLVLDARPGGIIYRDLIPEYVNFARTIYEDLKSVLNDDDVYNEAASEAFPVYNKSHMIYLEMPGRFGDVLVTSYGELRDNEYLDPKTAQVAIVDHVKQVCTEVRPATDEELPSLYIEEYRCALEAEMLKYVGEAYPKGFCSVYCINGKDVEGPGSDFEFVVVISAARLSPQNFCNGSWRSIWNIEFKDDIQLLELKGKLQVGAHYFEEGNVQLDAKHECRDSTMFQSPDDSAIAIAGVIRHRETEYLASLEASYLNLPDTTFKDLRRKLPVTRTLFPWHNTSQFSLTREISKELGIEK